MILVHNVWRTGDQPKFVCETVWEALQILDNLGELPEDAQFEVVGYFRDEVFTPRKDPAKAYQGELIGFRLEFINRFYAW